MKTNTLKHKSILLLFMAISSVFTASAQPFSFNSLAPKSRNAVIPLLHIDTSSVAHTLYNYTPTYNPSKIDNGKTDFIANQDFLMIYILNEYIMVI